jgi:hypothetical protein
MKPTSRQNDGALGLGETSSSKRIVQLPTEKLFIRQGFFSNRGIEIGVWVRSTSHLRHLHRRTFIEGKRGRGTRHVLVLLCGRSK